MKKKSEKRQEPEYVIDGKPIKDDAALIGKLERLGWLEVGRNVTVYRFCGDLISAYDYEISWTPAGHRDSLLRMVEDLVDTIVGDDPDDDLNGIMSFAIADGPRPVAINGRGYTPEGAIRKLAELGVITIEPHRTTYRAKDDEYSYLDEEAPLASLKDKGVYKGFREWLEELPDDEFERQARKYGIRYD